MAMPSHFDYPPRVFIKFFAVVVVLSLAGGYQLSQLFNEVSETSAQRSIRLLEVEERLDDAAIGLGRQIQEWKNMLLRADNKALHDKHQEGFKEASIGVQLSLQKAKAAMQEIGMDTGAIDQLAMKHKALLSEYLIAFSRLKPMHAESSRSVDLQIMGVDRELQQNIAQVKSAISAYAMQQLSRDPAMLGNQDRLIGLLGAAALFSMGMLGFALAILGGRRRKEDVPTLG